MKSETVLSWAIPSAIIVGVEYALALIVGLWVGFHYSIPFGEYAGVGAIIALLGSICAFLVRFVQLASRSAPSPTKILLHDSRKLSGFVVGCILVTSQMAVLMWLKIMLPFAVPFWADPLLANMDHALFRAEPWQLARGIGDYALIDRIYVTWGPVMLLTVSVLLLLPESSRKTQSLLSYFLTFAAGAIGEYVLSSAGPVFYQSIGLGDRFANLHVEPWVRTAADYLWAQYQHAGGEIGGGISAMPSLHVAIAAWIALVMRAYVPKAQLLGWVWFAAIFFGSVYLGWHYAMDGIVGVLITAIAWWCAGMRMPQAGGVADQETVAELEPLRR